MIKQKQIVVSVIILSIVAVACMVFLAIATRPASDIALRLDSLDTIEANINQAEFVLFVPKTTAQRINGLSDVDQLADNKGMLFREDNQTTYRLWMKDMLMSIDILWVDQNDKIIHLAQNISPETYPQTYQNPTDKPAAYAIELAAGAIDKHAIRLGDKVSLRQ